VQEKIASLMPKIAELPQPVVAAVNGPAAGGGLAIALASDTRICTPSARFNAAFVRIGLSGCDVGVSWLLPRLVGPTLAFDMMLSGRLVDAEEALRTGLVLRVVPEGEVLEAGLAVARSYAANTPFGVRMTKQVMWANLSAPTLRMGIELENRTQILATTTEDHREAMTSFLQKRQPEFRDR
jgi:enoyl-CoA hydratase